MNRLVVCIVILVCLPVFGQTLGLKPDIQLAIEGANALRDHMRDPDSFKVEKVSYWTNGKDKEQYCYSYRARNGFGGMNRDFASYNVTHKREGRVEKFVNTGEYSSLRGPCKSKDEASDITADFNAAVQVSGKQAPQ